MRIDHVLFGAADLEAAGDRLEAEFGLPSVPGGRHRDWGTGNRIAPLGSFYLELIGVLDQEVAAGNFLGRYLHEQVADRDRLVGWCLATDVQTTADRLSLEVTPSSRTLPDGRSIDWRLAGLSEAIESRYLPFFIQWDVPGELHPGRMSVRPRIEVTDSPVVEVAGDAAQLSSWLGGTLPDWVVIVDGTTGIQALRIPTSSGEIVLR